MKKNILMLMIMVLLINFSKAQVVLHPTDISKKANSQAVPNVGSITGTIYYEKHRNVNFFAGATQVELHEVIENKTSGPNGFANSKISIGAKINGITFTKPNNAADSFKFSIGHIPLNKKFIIMLRYYGTAGDGGTGNGGKVEITNYSNSLAIRGAFFYCTSIENNQKANIISCTEANKDIVNYWIMINDNPEISIH
jgi:hypothetical protein